MTRQPRSQRTGNVRARQRTPPALPSLEVLAILDYVASLPPARRISAYAEYLGRDTSDIDELLDGSIDLALDPGIETQADLTPASEWSNGTRHALALLFGPNAESGTERRVAEAPVPYQPGSDT